MTDKIKYFLQKNLIILIISIALVAIFAIYSISTGKSYVTTGFSIQFNGIEKGINPDNTRFVPIEIISPEVLNKVFKEIGMEYKDEYEKNFSISPVLPGNIFETLKQKRINGEDYTYFPNEFVVKIEIDDSIGLNKEICERLASSYTDGYRKFFVENYSYPFRNLSDLEDYLKYEEYDYPEYKEIFDTQFKMIYSYLSILEKDDPAFISSKGYTFLELRESVRKLQRFDLNKINALVSKYYLSKDNNKLKIKYAYMIKRYALSKNAQEKNYEISNNLLNIVKANEKSVMLTGVGSDPVSLSVLNESYDELAKRATEAKSSSSNIDEEIARIQYELQKLDGKDLGYTEEVNKAKKDVSDLASALQKDISNEIVIIDDAVNEYFNFKYKNVITSVYNSNFVSPISKKTLVILLIPTFILVYIVFNITTKFKKQKYNTKSLKKKENNSSKATKK